jgi:zinc transporter ZupT
MSRTNVLKTLYTAGAIVLAGLIGLHVLPKGFEVEAAGAMTYLVMHSWLPSAKTGAPQG